IVTPKGDVAGVLRSIDAQTLVLEVGAGDQRRLQLMRRDGYVQDIKLPPGKPVDKPSLVWRLATKKPGKHTVEVTYRATGLSWTADYLAIFDEGAKTIDFSAWATLRNSTGTSFDGAQLTLVSGGNPNPTVQINPYVGYGLTTPRQTSPPVRFTVPNPVHVGNGESVQVELMAPRIGAKARSVVVFDAVPSAEQLALGYAQFAATDCTMLTQSAPGTSQSVVSVEVDLPGGKQLPDGRVRVFKRSAKMPDRLEVLGEEQLRAHASVARIKLASHTDLVGERKTTCNVDERAHTLTEKVEVKLENKGKSALDTVVRETLWRYPVWRIDAAGESVKGARGGAQVQEYRVSVPAGGKKSVTYTVVYQWP
ncbi:MAG TPA: DUF4139 domain-containing protein, partial [Kofleriaceae bacterium]